MIPNAIIMAKGLSLGAKALYGILLSFAWQAGECFPGHKTLAEAGGCHRNTIQRHLNELRDYGLISWKRVGLNKPNVYTIHKISEAGPPKGGKPKDDAGCPNIVHQDTHKIVHQDGHKIGHKEYSCKNTCCCCDARAHEDKTSDQIVEPEQEQKRAVVRDAFPGVEIGPVLDKHLAACSADEAAAGVAAAQEYAKRNDIDNVPAMLVTALSKKWVLQKRPKPPRPGGGKHRVHKRTHPKVSSHEYDLIRQCYIGQGDKHTGQRY